MKNSRATKDFSGRHVLITGGSRGLGEALAEAFVKEGALVSIVARDGERLKEVASRLGCNAFRCDLGEPGAVPALVEAVEKRIGPVDVLVNNAALAFAGGFAECDAGELDYFCRVNLAAPMMLTRALLPNMLKRGRGCIVNISSVAGAGGVPGLAAYSATKAALSHFTPVLRMELAGTPVRALLVELGNIKDSGMLAEITSPRAYAPMRAFFGLSRRLGMFSAVPREYIAARVVEAVRKGRRSLRIPRRLAIFPMIAAVPRRLSELTFRLSMLFAGKKENRSISAAVRPAGDAKL